MRKKNENIIEFYEKIQQENEKLESTAAKVKEKIAANNKKRSDKIISDLNMLCEASNISMLDVLRLMTAIASSGTDINDIISFISDSSDNSIPAEPAKAKPEEAEEITEAESILTEEVNEMI